MIEGDDDSWDASTSRLAMRFPCLANALRELESQRSTEPQVVHGIARAAAMVWEPRLCGLLFHAPRFV